MGFSSFDRDSSSAAGSVPRTGTRRVRVRDGALDSGEEEGRSDPEHHQTIGGLQRRKQPHAALERHVAKPKRRERDALR